MFRYDAYLKHEEFWDMYLEGKAGLTSLIKKDDALSVGELYDKFLRDMANRDRQKRGDTGNAFMALTKDKDKQI